MVGSLDDVASSDDDLLSTARDAAYTAIGFAVIGVQRALVVHRELTDEITSIGRSFSRHFEEAFTDRD